jgi:hypothetical protein
VQKKAILGFILAIAAAVPAMAQPSESTKFYKLDYVVKELEGGKVVNSRNYSSLLQVYIPGGSDRPQSQIRAGGRVPVTTGNGNQFYDVGVNLDSRDLREAGSGEVTMYVNADISTIVEGGTAALPMVRQNKWSSTVMISVKKPTVIFSSDDLGSKRQLQLELTATPVAGSK